MRRILPVPLVLLAILAIAWFLQPTEVGVSGGPVPEVEAHGAGESPLAVLPRPAEDAHLAGRPDAAKPPSPASAGRTHPLRRRTTRHRFYGTVRDARGTALPGVRVYQLSKERSQGSGWRRAVDGTDEKGWWWFEGVPPSGTWICARHPGYRTTFAAAESASPDGELHVVLEEAPPLHVQLVDAHGKPVERGTVRVIPMTRHGRESIPGAPVAEQLEMTGTVGTATFRFDVPVAVAIVPEVEGMVCVPSRQVASTAEGSFTFAVLSAGGLELKAVDELGRRIAQSLWVSVCDPETGEELASYRSSEKDGALEVEPSLPPGHYHLDVSARGYEPAVIPNFELLVGPAVVKHTLTLRPLGEGATLRILLPGGSPERGRARGRTNPQVFLLRQDADWEAMGWVHRTDYRWDAAQSAATLMLRPGTYEIVLCRPQDGSVAVLGPLTLRAGQVLEERTRTGPGVSFALYDVLPPDLTVCAVRIRVPGRGLFPPVGTWWTTSIRDAGGLVETLDPPGSDMRKREGGGAQLGPYPGSHVVLEVEDWNGRTHRFTVRR